jgi:type IX secretion system PorP/SprF family membrane protein
MKLGLGIAVGMYNSKVGTNWIASDGIDNDTAIPITGESSTVFDASFGVALRSEQLYVGLSATHLSGGDLSNVNVELTQHFYFEVGYDFILGDAFKLTPNVLVKTDFVSTQFDVNLTAMWNNIVWFGVSYRFEDAVAPMVGLQFPVGKSGEFRIGYSYDITTSQLKNYSSGTNEIFVNYNMSLGKPLDKTKYKNVRFL